MKNLLLITLFLIFKISFSQVGNVQPSGQYVKIFNDKGSYITSFYIGNSTLEGFNNKSIVISNGQYVKIYDSKGNYQTSFYIGNSNVKYVSSSNILIKDGHYVKYYDLKGNYTGYCIYE